MQKFSTPFKVGLVILLGIIMAVIMIMKFSTDWGQKDGIIHLTAYFSDATGLAIRSQVRIAGIQVGEVESIALEGSTAKVRFTVREDVALFAGVQDGDHLRNSATVTKELSGILGDYILNISTGLEGNRLVDGDTMPLVLQDTGITSIMSNADDVMGDVKKITSALADALGNGEDNSQITMLLKNLNDTLSTLRDVSAQNEAKVNAIIEYLETLSKEATTLMATGNEEIPSLIEELHEALADMRVLVQTTNQNLNGVFNGETSPLERLNSSMDRLDRSLANIEDVTNRIHNGEGSVGKLLNDDSVADEAENLLKETRELIASGTKTVDSANSLLKPISDMTVDLSLRGDYLVNANALKVDFGVKLQSKPDTYYLIDLIMDPKGSSSTKSIMTYSSETGPVYETVTTNDDSFKFSAQIAKRWRWFVGRFGLIENTGGLGGDMLFFEDDLQFKFDLFAFNDNEYPRFRGTGFLYFSLFMPWEWTKTFYLTAGFDDPINTDEFDYYFGIGFRFTDNDVKSILSLLPTP